MKHLKPFLTFILILAVLVAAYFASVYLADKARQNQTGTQDNTATSKNIYTNSEFGYSLELPADWTDYKTDQTEENILFYLPTSDPNYTKQGINYGAIFYIVAIPLKEAETQDKKCASPDPDRYWGDCIAVLRNIGENNLYRFAWNIADDYPADFAPEKIDQAEALSKNIKVFDVKTPASMRTFNRSKEGYSLQYPTNVFTPQYGSDVFLPYSNANATAITAIELAHMVNTEYCALSGECTPTTTNMKFSIANLDDQSFAKLKKTKSGTEFVAQTYGTNKALVLAQGAEGEGAEYYFIENPNGGVLMMSYFYINENIVNKYKTVKGFIPYAQQTHIIEDIVKSIKFTK